MRTLLVLMFVASCTTTTRHAPYTATRTSFGEAPSSLLPDALAAARAKHYAIAAVDATHGEFVALPAKETSPGVHTAMVVRLSVSDRTCSRRHGCIVGARTVVAVTPVALRDGRELTPERMTEAARDSADDLSWAILSSARH